MFHHGDCLEILPTLQPASVDCVITDPPYPEIDRPYGRLTEAAWHDMMRQVVPELRRVLTPKGSALIVLQANQEHVGKTRLWLWEFVLWAAKEWNLVQDVYWWNSTAPPTVHCSRKYGLMKPSVKHLVWLGPSDCYRRQENVLNPPSKHSLKKNPTNTLKYTPDGRSMRNARCLDTWKERGGVTPFNLIKIANANSVTSSGAHGHGAGTPGPLCEWWIKYLCPPGGTVLDPFFGAGSVGVAAKNLGREFVGIEKEASYLDIAAARLNTS